MQDYNKREILVLGDSLLVVPEMFFEFTKILQEKIEESKPNFEILVSANMKGGLNLHNISKLVHHKFTERLKQKKPYPDIVIYHANSDYFITDNPFPYERRFAKFLKYLKRRVRAVIILSPGLFSPLGECSEHWNDSDQFNSIKVGRIQSKACKESKTLFIDFRKILQDKIAEISKQTGYPGKDLSNMIGKKKDWEVQDKELQKKLGKDEKNLMTTWDYQGNGGMLTFDGEHLNRRGTKLLVSTLENTILDLKILWKNS